MSTAHAGRKREYCRPVRARLRFGLAVPILLTALALPGSAQRPAPAPRTSSDLAEQNLGRVAASAAQLQDVLRKEAGLLIELKRWVAREATDRGQIVEDADLTDQAIWDRLAHDQEFRSVATWLVQRYGYLLPKINPNSEVARERELVIQERARRLALAEAEENQAEQTGGGEGLPRSKATPRAVSSTDAVRQAVRDADAFATPEGTGHIAAPQDAPDSAARAAQILAAQNPIVGAQRLTRLRDPLAERQLLPILPAELDVAPAEMGSASSQPPAVEGRGHTAAPEAMIRRSSPYADIPSLYDMYRQAYFRSPVLERFGADVFRNDVRASDMLPMDLPVGPDYVVGPGDGLAIDIWGGISQRLLRTVDREGRLALPEVGPVLVSGRTMGEVQRTVQQILRTQFRDVSVDVSLARLRAVRVFVVGDVERPGAYEISSLSTPLNALFVAGGPTDRGSLRVVRHFRGKQLVQEVDVYDLLLRGIRSDLQRLENGDTVMVPPLGPQVRVEGMVRRPAIYELRGEKTLADALALAGGILPTATVRNIQVQRLETYQKRTMLSLDIPETGNTEAVTKQLESFAIHNEDEVRIFPIAPHNQDAVYLQGHALRPGRYSYRPGMKLTDLVGSYNDLMPEPATQYAEIIRLNPPDYRPSVESFDLGVALASPAAAPELKPLDTVRIFSRYDFQSPPTVLVGGEVFAPGTYRTSGQIRLRDAIHLAGGITPDAMTSGAQVFRSLPDSKLKILSVNLGEALAGNPVDNILLQPRDRIMVHRNPAKVDPPSVYLKGDVAKPGRYPMTTNMRVSDLIRLAGGLKRSAYPEAADLTRYLTGDGKQLTGEHQEINLAAALAGDSQFDFALRDGDTLTIRQRAGWKDIGASISVHGEVQHPGVYGIKPGERLSSVLKRAGVFLASAYPPGAVLERVEVQRLQEKSKEELIQRIELESLSIKVAASAGAEEQSALQEAAMVQRQRVLEALRQAPVTGRLVVRLDSDLSRFEKSPDDIEVRAGDRLFIPKRPNFVVVTGQVYNSNAITFAPRKNAGWFLQRAGGPTALADKKNIFIVRASGEVVSGSGDGWWGSGVLSAKVQPGDTIVVPEKPVGGSALWKNVLTIAQVASQTAVYAAIVLR